MRLPLLATPPGHSLGLRPPRRASLQWSAPSVPTRLLPALRKASPQAPGSSCSLLGAQGLQAGRRLPHGATGTLRLLPPRLLNPDPTQVTPWDAAYGSAGLFLVPCACAVLLPQFL